MSRAAGLSEEKILGVTRWRESTVFSQSERAALAYAEAMTREHVDVSDAEFAELRRHLDEAQVIELTAAIAWENFRARFNHALGIESQDFSEGAACPVPWRPSEARDARSR